MKEKTKKWLTIAGLVVVCIGLVFGISRVLYREPEQQAVMETAEEKETEVVVDREAVTEPDGMTETETEEPTEEELVIEPETESGITGTGQEVQKEPVKTEEEKPAEPPVLKEDADATNPDTPPAYEEEPKDEGGEQPENTEPPADNGGPKTGDTKDGMVYVEGFGWIVDEGEGSGTVADDMYENGNKIGIMD